MKIEAPIDGLTITVGDKTYLGYVGFIKSQYDSLCRYRDDGREPNQDLIDDIKAYKYILDAKDPKVTVEFYMEVKRNQPIKELPFRPREVANKLGWF